MLLIAFPADAWLSLSSFTWWASTHCSDCYFVSGGYISYPRWRITPHYISRIDIESIQRFSRISLTYSLLINGTQVSQSFAPFFQYPHSSISLILNCLLSNMILCTFLKFPVRWRFSAVFHMGHHRGKCVKFRSPLFNSWRKRSTLSVPCQFWMNYLKVNPSIQKSNDHTIFKFIHIKKLY